VDQSSNQQQLNKTAYQVVTDKDFRFAGLTDISPIGVLLMMRSFFAGNCCSGDESIHSDYHMCMQEHVGYTSTSVLAEIRRRNDECTCCILQPISKPKFKKNLFGQLEKPERAKLGLHRSQLVFLLEKGSTSTT
jgi:hypothetical protein